MKNYVVLFFLLFSFISLFSFDKGPDFKDDMMMMHIDMMKKDLGLSDDQVKKIQDLMNANFKEMELKRIGIEKAFLNIREELLKDEPDLTKIKSIIDQKSVLEADMEFNVIKRDLDIKPILTKEQFDKLKNMKKPMKMKFMKGDCPNDPPDFGQDCFMGDKDKMKKNDNKKKKF